MPPRETNNNLFQAIKNLVVFARETSDKDKSCRHMCRALLLSTRADLTQQEKDNLYFMIKTEILGGGL